jgi:hypothetical protein
MPTKKLPRHEVISLRLSEARVELLERCRQAFADELGRDVSLSEAAFLALEDRAAEMERTAARAELLRTPTASLSAIRRQWEARHGLSVPQWDVLAEYVRIGADEDRRDPPLQPSIPSRESDVALLDAFRSVYEHRADPLSRHTWTYVGNLGGSAPTVDVLASQPPDQQAAVVIQQVADRRARALADAWERPGNIGHCVWVAVREEGVDGATLDQVLAPYWPVLWRLAARGHWMRHDHRPVRVTGTDDRGGALIPPQPISAGDFTIAFARWSGGGLQLTIASRSRRMALEIARYPELAELRALTVSPDDRPWIGRYYAVEDAPAGAQHLTVRRRRLSLEFSRAEWTTVTDLLRRAWQIPAVQYGLAALEQEYGEHG